ncbi:MAG: phosphotransferase family protein, partial [Nocardioidaceae bacterium]
MQRVDREAFLQQLHAQFGLPQPVVADLARRATGEEVVSVERLVAGDEYEVYRVELVGSWVVYPRICVPGMPAGKAAWEAWAMGRARAGGVPVPEVLTVQDVADGDEKRGAMVVAAARGRQLATILPALTPSRRSAVLADLGRVLGRLHAVPMPGHGRPDP